MKRANGTLIAIIAVLSLALAACRGSSPASPTDTTTTTTTTTTVPLDTTVHRLMDGQGNPTPATVQLTAVLPLPGSKVTYGVDPTNIGPILLGIDPCANNACYRVQATFCVDPTPDTPSGFHYTEFEIAFAWSDDGVRSLGWTGGVYVPNGSCRLLDTNGIPQSSSVIVVSPIPPGARYLIAFGQWGHQLPKWDDPLLGRYAYDLQYTGR